MRAEIFFTNPRLAVLAVLFIVIMGGMAFNGLARQEDPTMTERWARVNTFLPGATAERMESLVSEPIETALREIPEVDEISSTSKAGFSVVGVELYDSIEADQVDAIWSEVRDALADVAPVLPAGASEPTLTLNKPLASTLIIELGWQQDSPMELGIVSRVAEALRLRLANLSGTEIAESWGAAKEELLVTLDPYLLAEAELSAAQVAARISAADTKTPAGRLRTPQSDLVVEVDAELSSPSRVANIPVTTLDDGSALRVADLGEVRKYRLDPPDSIALHDGKQVVFVNAKMQPGLQIAQWTERALSAVETFAEELPPGISLKVVYNQNVYTGARMAELGNNLIMALIIVLLSLIWFMGLRSAITVGIALPLSAAMVLLGMQIMSIPLHQMSVTGLIISLGLLIDNAIVVVEDYKLRRSRGEEIAGAIEKAIKHLLVPLGASTATTVFAFMPIANSPGGVGDFTGTLGVTVALSVASSFVLAMTVVPAVAGFIERRWPPSPEREAGWLRSGYSNARLTAGYRKLLHKVVARPALGIGLACILPVIGFALAPTLTQQFFPPVDRNQFQLQLALPAQASMADTQRAIARAEEVLRAHPDITDSFWTIGEGAPRVFYNVVSLNERIASFASGWVNTTSAQATQDILPDIQRQLAAALPEAEILAIPFEQGPPRDAPIEMRVVGPDLNVLREEALKLRQILSGVKNVIYTRASLTSAEPKLTFVPNESAAAAAGLATGDISRQLNTALSGHAAGTIQEGNTKLDVRVRLADRFRDDFTDLSSLPVSTRSGSGVPLEELGTWQVVPASSAIDRLDGERISTVQGFLVPFVLPATALSDFRDKLEQAGYQPPAGYALQLGGEAEQSSESMGNLLSMFVFFALAMAVVVILSLNSFRQSALIGAIGVLSFGLALFGVRLFGHPFGYMALIGSLGMMGLAINGAIIVLSALKANARASAGDRTAMVDTVVDATRHIISTTVTTIGGFVPLIIAGGTFWPPLATAIAGGVAGSAVIALLMVPAVFSKLHPEKQDTGVAVYALDLEPEAA